MTYGQWKFICARYEVITEVKIQVKVFWVVSLCSVVVGYKCFGGPCCLNIQGEDGGSMDL